MKTAIVLGASGMIGYELLNQLLASEEYSQISIFVRRPIGISHSKLQEHVVDFSDIQSFSDQIHADVLFSCLGTTLKDAGSKEAQYKVDFQYQYEFAQYAAKNDVKSYVLISSAGAKSSSMNFYLSMKGKLEDEVKKLQFPNTIIFQPGQLVGNRTNPRKSEILAIKIMNGLNKIHILTKYRPIHAQELASAMIKSLQYEGSRTFRLDQIFSLLD